LQICVAKKGIWILRLQQPVVTDYEYT